VYGPSPAYPGYPNYPAYSPYPAYPAYPAYPVYTAPPAAPKEPIWRRLARASTALGAALTILLILGNTIALVVGAPLAVAYAFSHPTASIPIFVVFPLPILLFWLTGPAAGVWHVFLVAAILASVADVARRHLKGAIDKLMRVSQGAGAPALSEENGYFALARLFSVGIFIVLFTVFVSNLAGTEPSTPGFTQDNEELLMLLAHASVWEEFVTRILLLGFPLFLVHQFGRGKLERPAHAYFLGGKFTLDRPAMSLLLFSSAVFAVAHIPGWDLWKVPDVLFGGMALGYLFLRYGLSYAITLHFMTDYLEQQFSLIGLDAYGWVLVAVLFFFALVGFVNFVRYVIVAADVVKNNRVPAYLGGPEPTMSAAPAVGNAPVTGPSASPAPPWPPA